MKDDKGKEEMKDDKNEFHLPIGVHRQFLGCIGFFLPWLAFIIAGIRPTDGLDRWVFLHSVSAYYYTGAVGLLLGLQFALFLFLFSYPGYKSSKADRFIGRLSGLAALLCTLFPTRAPDGVVQPAWVTDWVVKTHGLSAILLFFTFILFSAWLFPKTKKNSKRSFEKGSRDIICVACAIIMSVCVVWIAVIVFGTEEPHNIFLPETFALMAFGLSWLTKGESKPVMGAIRFVKRNLAVFRRNNMGIEASGKGVIQKNDQKIPQYFRVPCPGKGEVYINGVPQGENKLKEGESPFRTFRTAEGSYNISMKCRLGKKCKESEKKDVFVRGTVITPMEVTFECGE